MRVYIGFKKRTYFSISFSSLAHVLCKPYFFSTYVILVGSLSIVPLFENAVAVFFSNYRFFLFEKKNRKFLAISSLLFFHFKAIELNTKKKWITNELPKNQRVGIAVGAVRVVEARCGSAHLKCCVVWWWLKWPENLLFYSDGVDNSRHFLLF